MKCYQKTVTHRHKHGDGYVIIAEPGRKGRRRLEHRIVMEAALGRILERREVVHHRNHDPADNTLNNLRLYDNPGTHVLAEAHVARAADGKFTSPRNARKLDTGVQR
jgi:hypothetical protein